MTADRISATFAACVQKGRAAFVGYLMAADPDIETSYQNVATDPMDKPSPALHGKVAGGELGEKSGQGFYAHPEPEYGRPGWLQGEERGE